MAQNERLARLTMNRADVSRPKASDQRGGGIVAPSEGLTEWRPEKAGETFKLRVLPYEVTLEGHPDNVAVGRGHYRRPYAIHFDVGGSGKAVLCLFHTFGQKCPVCEEVQRLAKNYKENQQAIKAIKAKKYMMFAVVDTEHPSDGVRLFTWSPFKFADHLEKALSKAAEPKWLDFAQPEGGMILRLVTGEGSFAAGDDGMKDFTTTERIDFIDGGKFANLPPAILDKLPNLDEMFNIPTYDEVAELFNGNTDHNAPNPPHGKDDDDVPMGDAVEQTTETDDAWGAVDAPADAEPEPEAEVEPEAEPEPEPVKKPVGKKQPPPPPPKPTAKAAVKPAAKTPPSPLAKKVGKPTKEQDFSDWN